LAQLLRVKETCRCAATP